MQDNIRELLKFALFDFIAIIIIVAPFIVYSQTYIYLRSMARTGVLFGIFLGEILIVQLTVGFRKIMGDFGFSFDFIERFPSAGEDIHVRNTRMYCEKTFFSFVLIFWFPFDMILKIFLVFRNRKEKPDETESVETEQDAWKILKKMGINDPDKDY